MVGKSISLLTNRPLDKLVDIALRVVAVSAGNKGSVSSVTLRPELGRKQPGDTPFNEIKTSRFPRLRELSPVLNTFRRLPLTTKPPKTISVRPSP